MSFGQIFFIILMALIIFFLFKVGIAILIVALIIGAIYYIYNAFTRPRPVIYEYYKQLDTYTPRHNINSPADYYPQQFNSTEYPSEYWYIPAQEYFDITVNNYPSQPTACHLPSKISEYCVDKHIKETGDLNLAISKCTHHPTISANCKNFN